MQTIHALGLLRAASKLWRSQDQRIALVPTMGALHAGHMALVEEARARAERVVVSIFVNPTQFAAGEDLDRYPRQMARDVAMLEAAEVDLLWAPDVATMYPDGFATSIDVGGVSEPLEGVARPGHFAGVATVVAKLFNQVGPDLAIFGEKDFQQLAVIRRLVNDLDLGIEIVGIETKRSDDGLALSSRNAYLADDLRAAALALPQALTRAAAAIAAGDPADIAIAAAKASLIAAGFDSIDYVALADAETLQPPDQPGRPTRLLAAARIGGVRLIDNVAILCSDQAR